MPFGDHLEELRTRLIRGLIAPLVLALPCFFLGKYILAWFTKPIFDALLAENLPPRLTALSPVETLMAYFKISLVAAVIFACPVLLYQLWRFVAPGLRSTEVRFARFLVPSSTILMLIGILFMYYIMLPLSLRMLIRFAKNIDLGPQPVLVAPPANESGEAGESGVEATNENSEGADETTDTESSLDTPPIVQIPFPTMPAYDHQPSELNPGDMYFDTSLNQVRYMKPDGMVVGWDAHADTGVSQQFQLKTYLNLILGLIMAFSVAFQLPLVLLLLGWVGLVSVDRLRKGRKYAILCVFICAAALTPPDVVSQLTLALPLYLLFEISILALRFIPFSRVTGTNADDEPSDPG